MPRRLTFAERAVYGRCVVCNAPHGSRCVFGTAGERVIQARALPRLQSGPPAHALRIQRAPQQEGA